MPKIKDIPKIDRPRERFLKNGANSLSNSDLLAILLGSGIKGKNVKQLSDSILKKFGANFLNITTNDLQSISGIGEAKALQIVSAISLVKRFNDVKKGSETFINNTRDVLSIVHDLREKKKEHLVCLYLDARNSLIKKELISVGILDKSIIHPREIFYPATELHAASIILIHNHPSGSSTPSTKDKEVVDKIVKAGEIMGISVIDFIIVSENDYYSFHDSIKDSSINIDYVSDGTQATLFDLMEIEKPVYEVTVQRSNKQYFNDSKLDKNNFHLQNRRYLGNKYKLLGFIEDIVSEKC
ncbi:MAG: DNA repair protein RadC, partial [bacterium]